MATIYKCLRCGIHHYLNCPICSCVEHEAITALDLTSIGVIGSAKILVGDKHTTLIISLASCTKKIVLKQNDLVPHSK